MAPMTGDTSTLLEVLRNSTSQKSGLAAIAALSYFADNNVPSAATVAEEETIVAVLKDLATPKYVPADASVSTEGGSARYVVDELHRGSLAALTHFGARGFAAISELVETHFRLETDRTQPVGTFSLFNIYALEAFGNELARLKNGTADEHVLGRKLFGEILPIISDMRLYAFYRHHNRSYPQVQDPPFQEVRVLAKTILFAHFEDPRARAVLEEVPVT